MNQAEEKIFTMLCDVIEESELFSLEVMNHIDNVIDKLAILHTSNDIANDVDNIINHLMTTVSSMQSQDIHRQKIERIANLVSPNNDKFARAKHISGDASEDLVGEDDLDALIAQYGN